MDKQKQIEEMAQCKNSFGITCNECCTKACDRYSLAEELYNEGYRKIPEGAVVPTGEEKQKLLHEMYEQGKFDAIADLENDGKVVLTKEELEKMRQGIAAEVLAKVRTFVLDNEVGLKYLLDRTEKEYGITKGEK